MAYVFGVDLGGTSIKLGLFQEDGRLITKAQIPTRLEKEGAYILADLAKGVYKILEENNIERKDLLGIGIGVPGPVVDKSVVLRAVNLGWKNKDVKKELEALIKTEVVVGNDANVAALGEMWKGAARGIDDFLMVTLGTGVGGAIVADGLPIIGKNGAAGEIGHINVNPEEEKPCSCGQKGCLEQYSSARGIVRIVEKILASTNEPSKLRDIHHLTAKEIFSALKDGDKLAEQAVNKFAYYLGRTIGALAAALDFEAVVIGGGVSKAGQPLLDYVEKHFRENSFFANKNLAFKLAELGNDAGIYGAAKYILDEN